MIVEYAISFRSIYPIKLKLLMKNSNMNSQISKSQVFNDMVRESWQDYIDTFRQTKSILDKQVWEIVIDRNYDEIKDCLKEVKEFHNEVWAEIPSI